MKAGDDYNRTARLYPAFLLAFPLSLVAVVAAAVVPPWWGRIAGLAVASGLFGLAAQLVRDQGVRAQAGLWAGWGGAPTTQLLRWRGATNRVLHEQRRLAVAAATGIALPSETDEQTDPQDADDRYEAAVARLRERTRGDDFSRVHDENAWYGFRRNLYGCRAWARAAAAAGVVAALTAAYIGHATSHKIPVVPCLVVAAFDLAWLCGCYLVITSDFVRRAGDRYAERLISAADNLPAR